MFTLFKEIWMVPLLLALSMLAVWFIARLRKRKSPKTSNGTRIDKRTWLVVRNPDEVPQVTPRELSGILDHDFQTLGSQSSKVRQNAPGNHGSIACASKRAGEDSVNDGDLHEFDERELTDRSFDAPLENLEPIVFPRPTEPALVLSNDSLRATVNPCKPIASHKAAATSAQHLRRDRGQSLKQNTRSLSLPPADSTGYIRE